MGNLEEQRLEDLRQIRDRIKNCNLSRDFEEYAVFYYFSNEQINRKYAQIDFTNYHTALTVLSSGDHAFNIIYKGIDLVDTFDINRMTEYYALGFKKRAIECLSFEQFYSLYDFGNIQRLLELEDEVIKCMDREYKKFWESFKYELNCLGERIPTVIRWTKEIAKPHGNYYNSYLENEESYKRLQKRLETAKITFTQGNITEIPTRFGTYDFIELSNILTYQRHIFPHSLAKYNTTKLVRKIYEHNLKGLGTMLYQTGGTIVGNNPLSCFAPKLLKRAKNNFDKNNTESWVYGLQKGDRK
ncbi:MAG: DUF3419 family protein [Bacilli bacterium]|nr:DUF3419 family protein [Bacilli bacterium]